MAVGTYRQLYYLVMLITTSLCVIWGSSAIPAAYETDGRAGALLMMLVLFSIFSLVGLFGFIAIELSDELAAEKTRKQEGRENEGTENTQQKKIS